MKNYRLRRIYNINIFFKTEKKMAINKYIRAALKTLSNVNENMDMKKNYKLIRQLGRVTKRPRVKLTYQPWDSYIKTGELKIPIRIFSPTKERAEALDKTAYPVIVFLHGGGWVTGDVDTYEKTCLAIARQTDHMVVAIDYRLAPENPFPAALEDCYSVVRAVVRWNTISGAYRKVILMGDSAGGNLAAALSLYMRDRGDKPVDKQILIYPATYNNHTEASPFPSIIENGTDYILTSKHICDYMDLYCAREEDRISSYCAPLLADDFSGQPDTLIITAEYDPLRDEGEEYGRKLQEAGNRAVIHRMENAMHGYFSLSVRYSMVKESYRIINRFLREENEPDE